jgi:hypothetical protein
MRALIGGILLFFLRPANAAFARWRFSSLDRKTQILVAKLLIDRRRSPYLREKRNRYLVPIFGMPIGTYGEPKLLDMLFGSCVAQCNSTIAAGTAAQTTFNLRGSAGSGNADVTPVANDVWLFVTPGGTAATQNQYTNADVFLATAGTATSITFASRTVVAARAVGDFGFKLMTTTTFTQPIFLNTVYVGLSTAGAQTTVAAGSDLATLPTGTITVVSTGVANGGAALTGGGSFPSGGGLALIDSSNGLQSVTFTGVTATTLTGCSGGTGIIDTSSIVLLAPTSAVILAAEPTATGSYARVAQVNNPTNFPASSGSAPATKNNGGTISFPASTAAFSSGATAIQLYFIADISTLAGGNLLAYGYLTNPQTVNASGITVSFAASALVQTLL